MKTSITLSAIALTTLLAGCATTTKRGITPQYVSPTAYQGYDCSTLEGEIQRVSNVAAATEKQNIGLSATGIGIGVVGGRHGIYPSLSFGLGSGSAQRNSKQGQLSRLYGEHDAMVVVARQKGCSFANGMKIYGE